MDWPQARERLREPIFAPLGAVIARLPPERWPTHEELTATAQGIVNANGKALRFVPPRDAADERGAYEAHIAASGEVPTRPGNWHDLFNALAWIAFPRAKSRINAQHAALLAERGEEEAKRRGPERDALTLFDEGGVAVASSSPALLRLVADREWKELFWRRRAQLESSVRFIAFGHALYEKALAPYPGIAGKTVFLPVDELFFMLPIEAQVERADALLAAHFSQRTRFASPRAMAPLPVMGVPGWHPGTADEAFYDDTAHFRPAAD
jgi:hypothetical protein